MITKTEAVFLGIGIVAHAAFLVGARRVPAPVYHYEDVPISYVEVEIPQQKEEPRNPLEPERPELASNTHVSPTRGAERRSDRTNAARPTTGGPSATDGHEPSSNDTPDESPSLTREPGPGDEYDNPDEGFSMPGLPGGGKAWQLPDIGELGANGPPAPTEAPKAKKVSRDKANEVIGAAIKEKDKALGLQLPAAGTVASTLKDAVWSSDLPEKAQGTFVVVLGPDGKVVSVTGHGAGGTGAQWDAIAANVKASLSSKGLRLTDEYKKGAIITVNVLSKMQNPSGTDPDSPVHFGTTTTFDISDLGAKPIRQVRTQTNVTAVK